MKEIKYEKLESLITYGNYTAFVYDDGTQVMYSGGVIDENTVAPYENCVIELYEMEELPKIKDIMQENLLEEMPQEKDELTDALIAKVEKNETKIYMLIL